MTAGAPQTALLASRRRWLGLMAPAKKATLSAFNQEANIAKRGALWGHVQQAVYDEVPFIEVGKFNALSARSAKLEGCTPSVWPFFWNTGLAK